MHVAAEYAYKLVYSENPIIQPLYNPESFVIRPGVRFRTTLHSIFTQ